MCMRLRMCSVVIHILVPFLQSVCKVVEGVWECVAHVKKNVFFLNMGRILMPNTSDQTLKESLSIIMWCRGCLWGGLLWDASCNQHSTDIKELTTAGPATLANLWSFSICEVAPWRKCLCWRRCVEISIDVQDRNDKVNAVATNHLPAQGVYWDHIWIEFSAFHSWWHWDCDIWCLHPVL